MEHDGYRAAEPALFGVQAHAHDVSNDHCHQVDITEIEHPAAERTVGPREKPAAPTEVEVGLEQQADDHDLCG